ncbi:MAG: peptidylprolyl isomerase, partial [Neisseria sp.]|nr:peptidylprolyl isomerase [Neisseria sp.]
MFATVEKYRTTAQVLLGVIGLALLGFGANSVASPDSDYIVKVGSQKVSQQDVRNELEAQGAQSNNQNAFNTVLQRAYLLEGAANMGIGVSLDELKKVIVDDASFHDENGVFSQQKFNEFLSQRRLTEDRFIEQIRHQFELQNLMNLAQSGAIISDSQVQQLAGILEAQRVVRTTAFDPRAFLAGIKADDAAVKTYYEANKAAYTLPQALKFEYVALSPETLAEKQTVSDAELKQAFDEWAKTAPASREVAHIMFLLPQGADKEKIKAEAEKVLAVAKANPADFAKLAKQHSQDTASAKNGGSLGVITPQGWPQAFSDEAFKLGKGDISGLVETPEGFHIIRVIDIKGAPAFEPEKARLTAELKQKKAQQEMAKLRTVLEEEAFASPDSLKTIA